MDTKTICEVVAWIQGPRGPPKLLPGRHQHGRFLEFCANHTSVYPYQKKRQEKVPNGCRFVYWNGPAYKQPCGAKKADDEKTSSIPAVQSQYNSSVVTPSQTTPSVGLVKTQKLEVRMTTSIGLYREVIKGLAIMQGPVPSEFIYIGYFRTRRVK